jgi:hypothetical protein
MPGRECFHCKQWIEEGEPHDCWTTTEAALTRNLPDDLREAWERLRETAVTFGEQRIYASHHSIMFSRKACYFFVRPKAKYLELCIFLGRLEKSPRIRKVYESSSAKRAHMLRVMHRDEVEAPITDWMREAYDFADPSAPRSVAKRTRKAVKAKPKAATARPKAAAAVKKKARSSAAPSRKRR